MKHTPETQKAIKTSIKHWEEILAHAKNGDFDKIHLGPGECALCGLFFRYSCEGCPIKDKTGKKACLNTPYYRVVSHLDQKQENLIESIEEEIEFLKNL